MSFLMPPWINALCNSLSNQGFDAYIIGGAVRDGLLGRPIHDYDICTTARPEDVLHIFPKSDKHGLLFGTIRVGIMHEKKTYMSDVTTLRKDGKYSNSRHPDNVVFTTHLSDDLKRRDFTVNALALCPKTCTIRDEHNGLYDLKNKILRTIRTPEERFYEDSLRVFRACRFVSQLGFDLDPDTHTYIVNKAKQLQLPSNERIAQEITRLFNQTLCDQGMALLTQSHLIFSFFPMLDRRKVEALSFDSMKKTHRWAHLANCCDTPRDVFRIARFTKAQESLGLRLIECQFDDSRASLHPHKLAISGDDIMAFGVTGTSIGKVQRLLYHAVSHGLIKNSTKELRHYVEILIKEGKKRGVKSD